MRGVSVWDSGPDNPASIDVGHPRISDKQADLLLAYLRSMPAALATTATVDDVLEPGSGRVPLSVFTDGTWIWDGSLPYYVEHYRLAPIPDAFLADLEAREYAIPEVSEGTLREAARLVGG